MEGVSMVGQSSSLKPWRGLLEPFVNDFGREVEGKFILERKKLTADFADNADAQTLCSKVASVRG
jgi:hypothetical protein